MSERDEKRDLWWPSPTVERASVLHLHEGLPFRCEKGAELGEIQVSYQSWGELSKSGDNAVLLIHPMTADCHAFAGSEDAPPGWWEDLVGPGRALDTTRHFVVCPNILGGCYGTTGPRFDAPDGEPWLARFPLLTPRDMMRAQRLFLRALGVKRVSLVVGPSMGGMIAWEWAINGGDEVDAVAVVAAPLVTSAQQIAWNWLQRRGIETDILGGEESRRFGQMVARGIGMISYRSPVGLEEKFGREWFKEPGSTLGERGMFNVESWLRHHGKRIAKRFCPYTWILYSRAMDLHDVSADFEGLLPALDHVRPRVLVVGISSDILYPANEVHLGADILRHLGKQAEYAEIRSPHGHDAFLLETGQLDRILRRWQESAEGRVPTRIEQELREVRLGVLGAGRVAVELARLLEREHKTIAAEHGLVFRLVALADSDPSRAREAEFAGLPFYEDASAVLARDDLDAIVEAATGSELKRLVEQAFKRRLPVVTSNKVLVYSHGGELENMALEEGVRFAFHASVAAGWPVLYAVERPLEEGAFSSLDAILSGSSNRMLELMERGASYTAALESCIAAGLTESAPGLDTSGWDAAQKLLLLIARAEARRYALEDLYVQGIESIDARLVAAAPEIGLRVKLVGLLRRENRELRACLRPLAVSEGGHLGSIKGDNTVVVLGHQRVGEIVHVGPSSGPLPAARSLLSDLVGLFDLSQSWTGRYRRADAPLPAPSFTRSLVLREDGPAVVGGDAGIPLLDALD